MGITEKSKAEHSEVVGLNWKDDVGRHRGTVQSLGDGQRLETVVGLDEAHQIAWLPERITG